MPVPAGGMLVERVPELLDRYGADSMLLIGGNLLIAREHLLERTREFVTRVESHRFSKTAAPTAAR
jgi:ribulose-bisphosphate carboxylase large chain